MIKIDEMNIGNILLEYLRKTYKDESMAYEMAPEQILGGYESVVYKFKLNKAFNKHMILKIYNHTYDQDKFLYDNIIQEGLSKTGLPIAKIHLACDEKSILGGAFVIMDHIEGHVMWEEPEEGIPNMLANVHTSIHNCEVDDLLEFFKEKNCLETCMFDSISAALNDFKKAGINTSNIEKWLQENKASTEDISICHGDFHPNNILVHKNQINGILDWHFSLGEPEHDVALTIKILTINSKLHVEESEWQKLDDFTEKYLKAYEEKRPIDKNKLDYYMVVHCLRDLGEGVLRGGKYRTHQYRVNKQLEIIKEITGISVKLKA